MTLKQLLNGITRIENDVDVSGITADSRDVKPGDVFIAYPGFTHDGRTFIQDAYDKGAKAVIFEFEDFRDPLPDIPCIPVSNLSQHVGEIAARFYRDPTRHMTVIGITGTNGKTSCTHFIAHCLQLEGIRCGVLGTLGYGFLPELYQTAHTTPDSIHLQSAFASLKREGAESIAMEVSSHALHQDRVKGTHFDIAVFTQLSRDHLDYHKNMASYAKAKELLFQQPGLRHGVVNIDDLFGRQLVDRHHRHLNLIGYSITNRRDDRIPMIVAKNIRSLKKGFRIKVQTPWGNESFRSPLLGRFNISNLMAVLGVLGIYRIPVKVALGHMEKLRTVKGRLQQFGGRKKPLVIVDYAHTPDALGKTLVELREHCLGKLICVFGCGGNRDRGKRPKMAAIAERLADKIILTNDNPRNESPEHIIRDLKKGLKKNKNVKVLLDRARAIQYAVQKANVDDIVLIAGKGHETTQVVGEHIIPFDDAVQVKRSLKEWT